MYQLYLWEKSMANPANNPLFKHFRQPAIYLKLPSGGKYWDDDAIDLPASGEIPIYPMTVKDEIVLKTPDALMNGEGMANTIASCCPNIKDPWLIPACDLDPILIAIRLASYGNEMDISSRCPHCNETNDNTLDLSQLLDNYTMPTYKQLKLSKITINFKPQMFKTVNSGNLAMYEQRRILNVISSSELSEEEKTTEFNKLLPKLTELNVNNIVNCIESIDTEDSSVTEAKYIKEFIDNCDRKVYDKIKKAIEDQAKENKIKPVQISCAECEKTYSSELNFENSNFFA